MNRVRILTLAVLVATVTAALALPALAAKPIGTINGTDGPGFTITIAKKPTKAGTYKLVIADKSDEHNFRLKGPGVNVATTVPEVKTRTFTVTLKKGTYTYVCDPHKQFMKGSFTIK